jgi:hypothetical protein
VNLSLEIGRAIPVKAVPAEDITPEMVDTLHATFTTEMHRLFDRTKAAYGIDEQTKLIIH